MNAEGLIARLDSILLSGSGYTNDDLLAALNRANVAIAEKLLLPGLADGIDDITAESGAMHADIPADFHRKIYLAKNTTTDTQVDIYDNIGILSQKTLVFPSIANEGDVVSIAIHGNRILYQSVPTDDQTISIMYYRRPTPMTESSTSFPDGLGGSLATLEEALDRALISHAAWMFFERLEQGLEGRKVDTEYYKSEFLKAMLDLSLLCAQESVQVRPMFNVCW